MTTCSLSTLYKLCTCVNRFEDYLALLYGRFKQLIMFIVKMYHENYQLFTIL